MRVNEALTASRKAQEFVAIDEILSLVAPKFGYFARLRKE